MAVSMNRGRRLAGRLNLVLSAVLALCAWLAVTALATRPTLKALVDLTPQARFSVSPETAELLRELGARDARLRIDTFYARLPKARSAAEQFFVNIQARIQELTDDLLVRYGELGGDRVEVRHYDVLGDIAESRARVEELGGLSQDNVVVVSVGKRHKELQLSLDLAEIDVPAARQNVAPGADQGYPTLRLYKGEEAISSAIRSLLVEGTPRIYFLQGFHEAELVANVADSYSELLSALRADGFEVGLWNLEKEGRIPDDAAIVALLEPRKELSDQATDVLLRWLRQGGQMFLNVSWSEVPGSSWNPTFERFARLCGFRIGSDLVCHLVPDPAHPESPGVGGAAARFLVVTGLAPHPLTRPLAASGRYPQLQLTRELEGLGAAMPAGVTFEPILRTGPWAWLAPRVGVEELPSYDSPAQRAAYGERTVGAAIDFAPEKGARAGHLVVLSGVAFVNAGIHRNGDLALNVFNWLAQRTELVTVRGNRYRSERIELAPQQIERARRLLRFIVPGGLFGLGLVVLLVRRRR